MGIHKSDAHSEAELNDVFIMERWRECVNRQNDTYQSLLSNTLLYVSSLLTESGTRSKILATKSAHIGKQKGKMISEHYKVVLHEGRTYACMFEASWRCKRVG